MSKTTEYRNKYTKDNYAILRVIVPKDAKQAIEEHITSRGYKKSLLARDMGLSDLSELVGGGGQK